jgi:hypothetical protein
MAKKKYWINIRPSTFPGDKYNVFCSKKYGNWHGFSAGVKNKEELFELLKGIFKEWEGYDSILQRNGEKVTPGNLELEIFAADVTADDVIALIGARKGVRKVF